MIAILTDKPNVGKEIARILGAHTREDGYMSGNGYMVFRYLYRYLECRKPYRRLWISSLTDEAVLEGMGNLKPGSLYDRMFLAADSRNKADWVLGLNASYALCQATGTGNNSLGRVQTPVLAAISSRYRERENHIATGTFPVFISLCKSNTLLKMRCTEEFTDREAAAQLYSDCKLAGHAHVTAISRQVREIEPPALYNLTELQKDANNYYGMAAGKSLEIAQRLYEKKLISYPRTAGRFLPGDVYDKLPRIMEKTLNRKEFRPYVRSMGINIFDLPDKVVDEGQTAEHHAIIITDTYPEGLNREEMQLYMMIIGRMLEAFMPACRAEYTTVDAVCAARNFRCHACRIIEKGWFGIFERESVIAGREYGFSPIPQLENGETAAVTGCSLIHRKDLPVSAYTDAELITYMDTAGLGTAATRTGILQTLIDRKYVRYSGKYIIPTRKGLYIYETVRNMKIAGTTLTSGWEAQLARMERGKLTQEEFMKEVLKLSGEVTEDIFRKCER